MVTRIDAKAVLSRAATYYSNTVRPHDSIKLAIREMHTVSAARLTDREYNPVYLNLLSSYRHTVFQGDYIAQRLVAGQIDPVEIAAIEFTVCRFIDLEREAAAGTVKIAPLASRQMEQNLPYANFYAGVFALARDEQAKAREYFNNAADLCGVSSKELATLVGSDMTRAKARLGRRIELLEPVVAQFAPYTNAEQWASFGLQVEIAWEGLEANPDGFTIESLLEAELEILGTLGNADPALRRLALFQSEPEARQGYVDILLTMARLHMIDCWECLVDQEPAARQKHLDPAIGILVVVAEAEPDNWLALKELAITQGLQGDLNAALGTMVTAERVRAAYDKKYPIEAMDVWEFSLFQAYCCVENAIRKGQEPAEADLAAVLTPPAPEWESTKRFELLVSQALARLTQKSEYLPALAKAVSVGAASEPKIATITTIGEVPARMKQYLELLPAATELSVISSAFEAVENGWGARAATLFTLIQIERALEKGEIAAAKQRMKALQKSGLAAPRSGKEIDGLIKASEETKAQRSEVDKCLGLADEVLSGQGGKGKASTFMTSYRRVRTPDLQATVLKKVETALAEEGKVDGAILIAWELATERELREPVRELFQRRLAEPAVLAGVKASLTRVKESFQESRDGLAQAIESKKYSMPKNLDNPQRDEATMIFDFFFMILKDLPTVRALYNEVFYANERPANAQVWLYRDISAKLTGSYKTQALTLMLSADPNHPALAIIMAEHLQELGRYAEAMKAVDAVKRDQLAAAERFNLARTGIESLIFLVKKVAATPGGTKNVGRWLEVARRYEAEIREAFGQMAAAESPDRESFLKSLTLLGFAWLIGQDFTRAEQLFDSALAVEPLRENSLLGKARLLIITGRLSKTISLFEQVRAASAGRPAELRAIDLYAVEAFKMLGRYDLAEQLIDQVLANHPRALEYKLHKARLQADRAIREKRTDFLETAAQGLALAELEWGRILGKTEEHRRKMEALICLTRAEILGGKGERAAARAAFRQAIEGFSSDIDYAYWEMVAVYGFVFALSRWGIEETGSGALVREAVQIGSALLEKYPFHPPAHQVLVAQLLKLNRESEALAHAQWLVDNGGITNDVVANVIQLSRNGSPHKDQATRLLAKVREKALTDGYFQAVLADAKTLVEPGTAPSH